MVTHRAFRHRLVGCLLVVISIGLISRQQPLLLSTLGNYPGDALWGSAVFFTCAIIKPDAKLPQLGGSALFAAYVVEFFQLYQRPWINSIRGTTVGHLFLGVAFSYADLVAYTVGIALALLLFAAMRSGGDNQTSA